MLPSEQPAWGRRGNLITVLFSFSLKLSSQGKFSERQAFFVVQQKYLVYILFSKHKIVTLNLVLTNHKGERLEILIHFVPPVPPQKG